jgi:ubiquinone biosynthesis protein
MTRNNSRKRYLEIGRILARNGFGWLWSKWGIGTILGGLDKSADEAKPDATTQPERLRLTFEELGTTYIKLGQALSTRPDLLPPEYVAELSKLQDHVPEVPYADIESAILQELGQKPADLFQSFDPKPLGAGSIGQVHSAVLADGTAVVVKVRLPGIEQLIEQDLAILGQVARLLATKAEFTKNLDLEGLVDEFAFTLRNELDFAREGQNAERIAAQFADDAILHVPAIFWEYSAHTVLTLEAIHGIKIDDLAALDAAGIDRHELAQGCTRIALVQVLDHGFFHADPHPGNFFVQPDGSIALLDYGMVGRLGDRLRESLLRLALAISRKDADRIIDELLALGATHSSVDRGALKRDIENMISRYDGLPIGEISIAEVTRQVTAAAQHHGLRLPSEIVVLARVVAMDEGLGAKLDPEFNFLEYSKPFFIDFWKKSHSPAAIAGRLRDGVVDLADLAMDLPATLKRLSGLVERGEVKVTSRIDLPDAIVKKAQQAANRIAISVLAAGLVIGLSVLTLVYRPAGSEGVAYLMLKVALAVGVLTGVWLISAFWKSAR